MTNYGRINVLWFDGAWQDVSGRWGFQPTNSQLAQVWRSRSLINMVRRLQPSIFINNRAGPAEDFGTPEQSIDWIEQTARGPAQRPWELCDTLGDLWGAAATRP